jgi:hypothetical protein
MGQKPNFGNMIGELATDDHGPLAGACVAIDDKQRLRSPNNWLSL